MKYFSTRLLFLCFVLAASLNLPAFGHTNVNVSQARNMLNTNDDIILVDVREETEYCGATGKNHIIGAVNYPWNSNYFQAHYTDFPKTSTILINCNSGTRSNNAANFLDNKGYTSVYDMTGGITAWINANYETVGCLNENNTGSYEPSLKLDTEQIIKTVPMGNDIIVNGFSVPSYVDWNNDGKKDLVIGEGSGSYPNAKVRVYLNTGTAAKPGFNGYFYAKSNGVDLVCAGSGDMGCFPLVSYWKEKTPRAKDLLIGQADGTIKVYYNIGTDTAPTFDGGKYLQAGANNEFNIDVGQRATPFLVDWNNDGWLDIVSGGLDGKIHIYINCKCNEEQPEFKNAPVEGIFAQENGADIVVPQLCSSPVVADFDGDGKKDIMTGNSAGQILFYHNVGTDEAPSFSGYTVVQANGVKINLERTARSRPTICNWTKDGWSDILIGSSDGKVHLYQGLSDSEDLDGDGDVDMLDFAWLASYWLKINCYYCSGADLSGDGNVDLKDLSILADNWLNGIEINFYDFRFDTNPGWTLQGQWDFGQPFGAGGVSNPYPDPNSGFTGTNVYGVNLSGDYATTQGGPYYLTAGPFDCSGHDNVWLKFARWLNTDDTFYAKATIEVSNNATDWNLVWQNGSGVTTDDNWQQMKYDISGTADNQPTVYIRWGYQIRAGTYPYSGWNIDDVQLWDYP